MSSTIIPEQQMRLVKLNGNLVNCLTFLANFCYWQAIQILTYLLSGNLISYQQFYCFEANRGSSVKILCPRRVVDRFIRGEMGLVVGYNLEHANYQNEKMMQQRYIFDSLQHLNEDENTSDRLKKTNLNISQGISKNER